jgi:hypothetical protein
MFRSSETTSSSGNASKESTSAAPSRLQKWWTALKCASFATDVIDDRDTDWLLASKHGEGSAPSRSKDSSLSPLKPNWADYIHELPEDTDPLVRLFRAKKRECEERLKSYVSEKPWKSPEGHTLNDWAGITNDLMCAAAYSLDQSGQSAVDIHENHGLEMTKLHLSSLQQSTQRHDDLRSAYADLSRRIWEEELQPKHHKDPQSGQWCRLPFLATDQSISLHRL